MIKQTGLAEMVCEESYALQLYDSKQLSSGAKAGTYKKSQFF